MKKKINIIEKIEKRIDYMILETIITTLKIGASIPLEYLSIDIKKNKHIVVKSILRSESKNVHFIKHFFLLNTYFVSLLNSYML